MRRLLIALSIALVVVPGCAVNRARISNYGNRAMDTTAAVTVCAMFVTLEALWNGFWEDDDDSCDDAAYTGHDSNDQRVRYE